ncbi:MAG TPA: response regulator transcription factor [Candidatus Obscuribacterales bacterium]
MAKILIVEDDLDFCSMVEDWLSHEHHMVETVHDAADGRHRMLYEEYDLIIVDWNLPGGSGVELVKELRNKGATTPVLLLTGKSLVSEKETGLDAGADDYLTKPANLRELSARVRALLRRASGAASNVLKAGNLTLDPVTFRVTRNGEEIDLQRREFALLEFLMRHPDQVFSAEALLERVWASESDATRDAIKTCLKRLRKKIDVEGRESVIKTVHGVGYKLKA